VKSYWKGKTEELGKKPILLSLCPSQISHGLTQARTLAPEMTDRAWATARPRRWVQSSPWWWRQYAEDSSPHNTNVYREAYVVVCGFLTSAIAARPDQFISVGTSPPYPHERRLGPRAGRKWWWTNFCPQSNPVGPTSLLTGSPRIFTLFFEITKQ
jgi:hypothetical protein